MEGWRAGKQDSSSGPEPQSVFQGKSLAFGISLSITALALLRVFSTFVCYTEAAQKKPNVIVPSSHPA